MPDDATAIAYNVGMPRPEKHSRRDFLQGRAAVRAVASKTQELLDTAADALSGHEDKTQIAHVHATRRAMACEFKVQFHEHDMHRQEDVLAAFDLIEAVEERLTIYRDQSEVIDINRHAAAKPVEIDSEMLSLLTTCEQLHRETGGAFDITSGPLSRAWGFLAREGRLPAEHELDEALAKVGAKNVVLNSSESTVHFNAPGTEINFNSIGKGYALDLAADYLKQAGLGDFLCHGGGSSVLACGNDHGSTKSGWRIGLPHPLDKHRRLGEFYLRDRCLGTAGGATQFFEHEGTTYSHILDPRTGWPPTETFTSTVLAPTAATADALATAFFVMEPVAIREFCQKHSEIGVLLVRRKQEGDGIAVHKFGLDDADYRLFATTP